MSIETSCCFTGHRPEKLPNGYNMLGEENFNMLMELKEIIVDHIENKNIDTFITGMALGIDTWAAFIILKLKQTYPHIKLVAAVPCANHSIKWNQESRDIHKQILDKCDAVHYVSEEPYTHWCMQDRNKWMVDSSNCVIAVWDGTKGGTANCVNYAKKKNKEISILQP